ncbi:EAL domain-containing protein [Brevibacillus sp. FSL K6-0770]|jgi:diguanylate cyclase (GGDEF)-like protein/PAS domain S-box-containing protein|uniref:Diguanylate cyclase n=2 Tax=Brevibacillus TaxID=55080 RepID=A0A4Y3PRT0_BREPA|nr:MULTISPECIES: bifunctional diguanylate cyclase/phosphodiesterase [Brevibacillus]MBU8712547.1 EAL domain-containing protein [Brevibacillus parabrevis]MDH6353492.1 diguanylate cyclase (GGDEF)-like protein/PAS domain S-box-containing protein [Brevibacillus sp. 1238]MDR5000167.1 EAL domain-containing protein [Brevibacillus parabrevis]NRQ56911.1 EAL domain-containing protein [Brevibacillus sp. HD1.4A]RNB96414.1 bifunctional diguanylate cyclase/phosphodiesterase [Brevibacillus parabrevis]
MRSKLMEALTPQEWEELLQEKDGELKVVLRELADVKYALDQSTILAITDHRGIILRANEQFCRISKYSRSELIGQDHRLLNSGHHPKSFFKQMWKCIGSGQVWRGEICNRAKDGSLYWVDTTIVPFVDTKGKIYQYVSIRNDITARKHMEEEVRKSEELYRLIAENTSDIISIVNAEGDFLYLSPAHKAVFDHDVPDERFHNLFEWIVEDDRDIMAFAIQHTYSTRKEYTVECRIQTSRKETIWTESKINPIVDELGNVSKLLFVTRDITDRKQSEELIHHLAYHDALTDLPNRRMYTQHLSREIMQAKRFQSNLAVLFLDLDRFKDVNDSFGHDVGDLLLVEAANRLKACLRPTDVVARLGGDEFTVLLSQLADREEAAALANQIMEALQRPFILQDHSFNVSCSIGIALYPQDGDNADDLLKRADTALYTVKSRGKNGYDFFDPTMEAKSLERILMENELRKAIEQEQFQIYYQPKIDIATDTLTGMEALVRWVHPELGVIPPNRFIPIAEETGMIIALGEWILRQACRQNKIWHDQGYLLKVSVNLSARQIYQKDLVEMIKQILAETELAAEWLELEITESIFVKMEEATAVLQQIRDIGIHISIDDFGTGYSSFSYIKSLPVDTIKIDASFIRDIHHNQESQAIVKAIVTIAQSLNMNVIAEGIELNDQAAALQQNGCDHGQGYLFSRPLATDDFERYLRKDQVS